eukprot:766791-Hanusia_phi.AAC.3
MVADKYPVKALCVGADTYRSIPTLHKAVSDARNVHEQVQSSPGCASTLLTNPRTRQEITDMLSSLSRECRTNPPQLLLVFFAGHGIQLSNGEIAMLMCDIIRAEESEEARRSMLTVGDLQEAVEAAAGSNVARFPPLLVIIDACRNSVHGVERIEPSWSSRGRMSLSLCLSCSRGQEAKDESEFLTDLLDKELGMFAQNRPLRQAIDHAVNMSRHRDQKARTLCTEYILDGFCIRRNGVVAVDIGRISEGGKYLTMGSARQQEPASGRATDSGAQEEIVGAYSHAPAETGADVFRSSLLGLVQESLAGMLEETPRWRVCSMFLLVFLRYEDTAYDSQATRGYFHGHARTLIGPELIRLVGQSLSETEVWSEELKQWVRKRDEEIEGEKMVVAAIDFSVRKELNRVLADKPEEARSEIKWWERAVGLAGFYHGSITQEQALDKAEEYLRKKIIADQEGKPSPLLAVHVLSQVVETGSCVAFLKVTRLSGACLAVMLARRVREALHGHREEGLFRTWVSSSGWMYGTLEHGELNERIDEGEVKKLYAVLAAVGEDETKFIAWRELERAGEGEMDIC